MSNSQVRDRYPEAQVAPSAQLAGYVTRALTELNERLLAGERLGLGPVMYPLRDMVWDLTALHNFVTDRLAMGDAWKDKADRANETLAKVRSAATRGTTDGAPQGLAMTVPRGGWQYSDRGARSNVLGIDVTVPSSSDAQSGYRLVATEQAEPIEQTVRGLFLGNRNAEAAMANAAELFQIAELRRRDSELASAHIRHITAALQKEVREGRISRATRDRVLKATYRSAVVEQAAHEASKKGYRQVARACRSCGCTDDDCSQCIEKTGQPCSWVAADLCSACA